ncbi:MAG TPA: MFS transporter [Steroidobacteraceae bacterium]|nr:MFS transporter [Steroidobacteraceae bacterium]
MTGEAQISAPAAPAGAERHYAGARAIMAASIGNALEWYDFTVYAFFAIYISRSVFAHSDPVSALVSAFLAYGVGFIARPIGAVLLGAYADRSGRRAALTLALILMAVGVLCIAVTPPYAVAGIGAPLLILCGRLLQGLSAGGEIGGAVSFLVEHAPPQRRGAYAAWLQSSMAVSNILGALVGATLTTWLTPEQLGSWGWRIPFILGLAIAPVGLWLRAGLEETPAFEAAERERTAEPKHLITSLRDVFAEEPRSLLISTGISIVWVIAVYTLVIYMPTYMQRSLGFAPAVVFTASIVGNIVMAVGCITAGRLSDRVGRLLTVRLGTLLILVAVYPVLAWVANERSLVSLFVGQTLFCALVSIFTGSVPAVVASLFPTRLRSTGVSITYNFAAVVFGGFAPAVLTFLTESTHDTMAPALYVVGAAAVSLVALAFVPRSRVQ